MFENKMSKQPGGEWIEIKIRSTGKSYKIDDDPVGCDLMRPGIVVMPEGYRVLQIMADIFTKEASEKGVDIKYLADGKQGFSLPSKTSFDIMTVWVFIKR